MSQLALRGVSKAYGRRVIFEDVSFSVRSGEHVGVVGDNGAGKSTLLRLIAGIERPDSGQVLVQAPGGLGHLDQTIELSPLATVQQAIDTSLADLRTLERELRSTEAALASGNAGPRVLQRYDDLLSAFEARGGYAVELSLDAALTGLGLSHIGRDRHLGTLSGGELRRLALGCLLASAPEVLLLDEPTNHLDDACLDWLEERLRSHRGTVVAVSHDRLFLERVATAILEVDSDQQTIVRYGDGYAGYLREKAAARQRWQDAYERWCDEVQAVSERAETTAREVGYGRRTDNDKMGYNLHGVRVERQIGSRVRNAGERLRRLNEAAVPKPPDQLRFNARFASGGFDASGVLLRIDDAQIAGRLHVSDVVIGAGERLLIRGPNGAGKTTLLRVCVGELRPERGAVRRRGRIGYLPQEVPAMHSQQRLLHAFGEGLGGDPEEHLPRLLSLGLFREDDLWVPVARLSVGQRQRLALARLLVHDYDLLLLDEPTNHLAPDLVEALEAALLEFPGALVIVSHDRLLRSRLHIAERRMEAGALLAG
jgi:macrolide transport system ATP-binding/permease protein